MCPDLYADKERTTKPTVRQASAGLADPLAGLAGRVPGYGGLRCRTLFAGQSSGAVIWDLIAPCYHLVKGCCARGCLLFPLVDPNMCSSRTTQTGLPGKWFMTCRGLPSHTPPANWAPRGANDSRCQAHCGCPFDPAGGVVLVPCSSSLFSVQHRGLVGRADGLGTTAEGAESSAVRRK